MSDLRAMRNWLFILTSLVCTASAFAEAGPDRAGIEFFESKVRPVLSQHCYKCHSAASDVVKGSLRLDSLDGMLKGGETGPAIVPGKPDKSLLVKAIDHDPGADLEMPPKTKLSETAIADLVSWIQRGAPWPTEQPPEVMAIARKTAKIEAARRDHWAFQPLKDPSLPAVQDQAWVKTPIDRFVLAKLEEKHLKPAAPANRTTLLRRVYLDLIGLPPTPEEQEKFLNDASPDALGRLVDDLLARPQYGERWGRHWLDVARFAESNGYEHDEPKPFAWRYRDYVIKAFNQDKPYNRFVTEQIAGDEIESSTAESQIATSFLRVGPFDTTAADGKLARYDLMDDIVGVTSAAFLGQTLRCARCHDHKFEPFTQADYYKLVAIFEPLTAKNREGVLVGSAAELAEYQKAHAALDAEAAPLQVKVDALRLGVIDSSKKVAERAKGPLGTQTIDVLKKPLAKRNKGDMDLLAKNRKKIDEEIAKLANPEQRAELARLNQQIDAIDARRPQGTMAHIFEDTAVKPGPTHLFIRGDCNKPGPEVPVGLPTVLGGDELAAPVPTNHSSGRRLWLAKWMTGPGQPLIARVMVNRIWQQHFGAGLVGTSNDFGLHGEPPTHPELLEWLAHDFVQGNWTIKRLHKEIILSSVYQTSSAYRNEVADPDGHLLAHWRTRRLESEIVRDSILAVSGKLNSEVMGPSVFPPLTQRIVGNSASQDWNTSDEKQSARRSVYICVKRNILVPELEVMGIADSASSLDRRTVATTALQSLMLLNSKFASQQAGYFAERVRKETADDASAQVTRAFEVALCRKPTAGELADSISFLSAQAQFAAGRKEAQRPPLESLCLVLLNTNEFIYSN